MQRNNTMTLNMQIMLNGRPPSLVASKFYPDATIDVFKAGK